MSVAEAFRNALIVLGAVPAIGFPIWYHLRMRWRETEMGQHVMGYSLVVAAAYASGVVNIFFKDYPFEWVVRSFVALGMTAVVWWRVIVFMHLRRMYHRDTPGPSMTTNYRSSSTDTEPENPSVTNL